MGPDLLPCGWLATLGGGGPRVGGSASSGLPGTWSPGPVWCVGDSWAPLGLGAYSFWPSGGSHSLVVGDSLLLSLPLTRCGCIGCSRGQWPEVFCALMLWHIPASRISVTLLRSPSAAQLHSVTNSLAHSRTKDCLLLALHVWSPYLLLLLLFVCLISFCFGVSLVHPTKTVKFGIIL